MNPLGETRNRQFPRRQASSGVSCPLCKQQQQRQSRHADERAFFAHVDQQHGDEIIKLRQENPEFDLQIWKDTLLASKRERSPQLYGMPSPPQTTAVTTSPNSSQEFGFAGLSLESADAKKRSTSRKSELPPRQDPEGHRSGMKRPKIGSEQQSPHSPPIKTRRGSPRAGRGRDRDFRGLSAQSASHSQGQPAPLTSVPFMSKNSSFAVQQAPLGANQQQHKASEPGPPNPDGTSPDLGINMPKNTRYPGICLQLDSREISQEQLAAEVKSIYSGLSMVEAKCIHVDNAQAAAFQSAEKAGALLAEDHWQALIALHRTLLHEHHDFFLASQHPSASQALKRLAAKYSMPARMWKHGIHSFLELLRCRLPSSREYMRTFIYFAYHMMALLFETVPSFEETWIECLGDLGRYRMAIEDDDPRERDIWAGISQYWYRMAADRAPGVGRLYHHLAILARSEPFQQVYYYCRSFTCVQLFPSARESVLAIFEPIFNRPNTSAPVSRIDTIYTKLHGMMFLKRQLEDFGAVMSNFLERLDNHIALSAAKWLEQGAWLAISNIGALFEHGSSNAVLRRLFKESIIHPRRESGTSKSDKIETRSFSSRASPTPSSSTETTMPEPDPFSKLAFNCALDLTVLTLKLVLRRQDDRNVRLHVHILLALLVTLADIHSLNISNQNEYVHAILTCAPWQELCSYTTTLADSEEFGSRFKTTNFLQPEKGDFGPLPDDYLLRGQIWTQTFFPSDWFQDDEIDAEERSIEHASTSRRRAERILSLMYRLASHNKWIRYDEAANSWSPIIKATLTGSSPQIAIAADLALTVVKTKDVDMDAPPEIETRDIADPPMEDPDSPLSEDDSEEMHILKREDILRKTGRKIHSQPQNLQVPSLKEIAPVKAGTELIREGFTVMVCDVDLLLNQQDVFKLIVDRGYPIVIPSNVISELFNLAKIESPKFESPHARAAQIAIQTIKTAINEHKGVQVLTQDGEDITSSALLAGKLPVSDTNDNQDPEAILIGVSRRATDLSSQGEPEGKNNQARAAILLTDNRATRVKASYQGVAALATTMLKKVLTGSLGRRRSSSAASSSSWHSGIITPAEMVI